MTLAIAVVALAVGVGAWLRPMPGPGLAAVLPEPTYTDEQIASAKANVCEAFSLVKQGVITNTHRINPVPGDVIGDLATGVYAPVMIYQGADYLLGDLATEPATPPELANAIKSLGRTMKKLAMIDLAIKPDSVRDPVKQAAEADSAAIDELCR
ncbi:MAG TPA: hypothetical protein VFR27_06390 [Mycobacterium sp.]|nr:hypothetical protein [Mycobacterium sp.]